MSSLIMDLPQSDLDRMKRVLEAALLANSEPMPVADLRRLFDDEFNADTIRRVLEELRADWQNW